MGKVSLELTKPRDVITTKNGQLTLKLKNKRDMEEMKKNLLAVEEMKNASKIMASKKGRERLLLLNVDKDLEEGEIEKTLRDELDEEKYD